MKNYAKIFSYFVMLEMIAFESDCEWNSDWKIGEHAQKSVGEWPINAESGTVRNFVNS